MDCGSYPVRNLCNILSYCLILRSFSKKNSEKSALVAMVLENEPVGGLTIFEDQENGTVSLAAITQSGALQIFSHQFNG